MAERPLDLVEGRESSGQGDVGEAETRLGTVRAGGGGGQVATAGLWHLPVRLGRQDVHTRPCFTQMQDIHFPRTLHRQQTGPADLETPFFWPKRLSGRRPGSGDGVGGRRLPVRLRTRGDAIASQTGIRSYKIAI